MASSYCNTSGQNANWYRRVIDFTDCCSACCGGFARPAISRHQTKGRVQGPEGAKRADGHNVSGIEDDELAAPSSFANSIEINVTYQSTMTCPPDRGKHVHLIRARTPSKLICAVKPPQPLPLQGFMDVAKLQCTILIRIEALAICSPGVFPARAGSIPQTKRRVSQYPPLVDKRRQGCRQRSLSDSSTGHTRGSKADH